MLKVKVNKGDLMELEVSGTLPEIGAELLSTISAVYEHLGKEEKEEFKHNMTMLLPSCFMSAEEKKKFFEGDIDDVLEDALESKDIDNLLNNLEDLRRLLKDFKEKKNEALS